MFITKKVCMTDQLDMRYYYVQEAKESNSLYHREYRDYAVTKQTIQALGYWVERDENGYHKVVKRRIPRFRKEKHLRKLPIDKQAIT